MTGNLHHDGLANHAGLRIFATEIISKPLRTIGMECCGRWQTDRQTDRIRQMNYSGLIIAVITFLVIGLFHPLVIKSEYYFGTKCWWAFALAGLAFIVASLLVENSVASPILGVVGCSCLWSILEIFEQRERVRKGWFPMNPKRKSEY